MQAVLIGLERQHIIPAPGGDGLGRRPLGVHRIGRHDAPLQRQHLQQHRRDLVCHRPSPGTRRVSAAKACTR